VKKTQQTRVKCATDGKFHKVEFLPDGRVLDNGTDITGAAKRMSAMLRLGRAPNNPGTCTSLAALILCGCETILRRQEDEEGFIRDLSGWREVYVRWESNSVVVDTMSHVRHRLEKHTVGVTDHPGAMTLVSPKLEGAVA
jgi:hypothetical protein